MFSVEISTSDESAALAESMKKMREWLDGHQVEPAVFRYSTTPSVVFRIEFAGEEQAIAEGMTEIDFLRHPESYKYLWGARDRINYKISQASGSAG